LWRVIRQQKADMDVGPERLTEEHWQRPPALVKSHESRATDHIVESRCSSIGKKHRLKNRFSSVSSNGAFRQVLESYGGCTRARTWDPLIKSSIQAFRQAFVAKGSGH